MPNLARKGWPILFAAAVSIGLIAAACGGGGATPTPRAAATPTTAPPTATPTRAAIAPTPTPVPSPTPVPATPTPSGPQPKPGGVLSVGQWLGTGAAGTGRWVSDPFVAGARSESATATVFNRLTRRDPYQNQKLVGELAESWDVSSDGAVITLRLAQNVKWHDGKPFTSQDVVYTFNDLYLNPPQGRITSVGPTFKPKIKSVQVIDPSTVKIELNRASASFLVQLSLWTAYIYPAHVPIDQEDANPVGTGPFKVKEVKKDVSTEVARNDQYWKKDAAGRQLPYLDGQKHFAFQDGTLMISAFRTGNVKHLSVHMTPFIEGAVDILKKDIPGVQLDEFVQGYFGFQYKNQPPFNDPKVRKAIDLWLDRKEFVDVAFKGRGSFYDAGLIPQELGGKWGLPPQEIMSRPGFRYLDKGGKLVDNLNDLRAKRDELVKDPADRQQALKLLEEAGIKPGQIKLKADVVAYEAPRGGPIFLAQMSKLFGATWEMNVPPLPQFTQNRIQGTFQGGIYNAYSGYSLDDPAHETLQGGWPSISTNFKGGGFPPDPVIDKLFADQDTALDPVKRRAIAWDLQRAILNSDYGVITSDAVGFGASWPDVKNPPDAQAAQGNTFDLEQVWLDRS